MSIIITVKLSSGIFGDARMPYTPKPFVNHILAELSRISYSVLTCKMGMMISTI